MSRTPPCQMMYNTSIMITILFTDRLVELTSKELTEDDLESLGEQDSPLSDEHIKIWSFLETRTTLLLRAYDTSVEVRKPEQPCSLERTIHQLR